MKLQSELDALLATARELVQAEDDAMYQISQLQDALTRSKATLKRTRTLAQATARRMRTVARRMDLAPAEALANARELAALEALVGRAAPAAEAVTLRAANVVPLRPAASFAPKSAAQEDANTALQTALREVMADLTPRLTLVLTRIFGLDLASHRRLTEGCRLDAATLAESLGVSTTAIYLDMVLAAERLREPSRAARLRPFYDALKAQDKRGGDVRLLRFLFVPKR